VNILVLHQAVAENGGLEERDVLVQVEFVRTTLAAMGHEVATSSCGLNLEVLASDLERQRPELVVNLVESLAGTDRLMGLPTMLLDAVGIPYTGSPTLAILATNDKLGAKRRMQAHGLPTPDGWSTDREAPVSRATRVIIKAVWEHASFGLGDASVQWTEAGQSPASRARQIARATGRPHFAEVFIDGREFNLSLLARGRGAPPEVLPPAEIDFRSFGPERARIVGYAAKWDEDSFECRETPRSFAFAPEDDALLDRLSTLAQESWALFGVRGYARVDFRVDSSGNPWILEVNANPCLSPDAGFLAACTRAGLGGRDVLERILTDALFSSESRFHG